ncbi:redox-regulated ATPase YchF [Candidatus Woesebacteria bacterium]|nr:MAG: redox-regulated ATPase YchF [Candidatus Woesebacteria bacterium]
MNISCGIVGLPNVGKSTLFNALLKKQQAFAANFPFATIEPNIGIVPVPDDRLVKLAQSVKDADKLEKLPPIVPATVEFVDIAGLIAGAHKGEGLGNKFLAHIRETDAILHVVRAFENPDIIREGSRDPISDLDVIETELIMADYQTIEKQKEPRGSGDKEAERKWQVVKKIKEDLNKGIPARLVQLNEQEHLIARELSLLTMKPILVALNISEENLINHKEIVSSFSRDANVSKDCVTAICAKLEEDMATLTDEERMEYLGVHQIQFDGLANVINRAFQTLGLITFLTAGEKEVRAWTITKGTLAPQAAGVIHTDFEDKFIKAQVIEYNDYIDLGGEKKAKESGKLRLEGKDYVVKDGDVIEFKVGA